MCKKRNSFWCKQMHSDNKMLKKTHYGVEECVNKSIMV